MITEKEFNIIENIARLKSDIDFENYNISCIENDIKRIEDEIGNLLCKKIDLQNMIDHKIKVMRNKNKNIEDMWKELLNGRFGVNNDRRC